MQALRAKVFTLKINILMKLIRAVEYQNSRVNALDECIKLISRTLSWEEADFLLDMDHLYSELGAGGEEFYSSLSGGITHHSGGLHDLLENP